MKLKIDDLDMLGRFLTSCVSTLPFKKLLTFSSNFYYKIAWFASTWFFKHIIPLIL
jgi:hypothetical protein